MTVPEERDPAWDPELRRQVLRAMNEFMFALADVHRRYTRDGRYSPPSDAADFGDLTGLLISFRNQVTSRLDRELATVREMMSQAYHAVDEHKHQRHGDRYQPPPRDV